MGKIEQGVLGGFSGTVATVVGSRWKGINYMRGRSRKKSGPASPAQLEQQAKFAMMMSFIRTFGSLPSSTFKDFANGVTGPNVAFSINIRNAVSGTYPSFAINYSMVLLSRGILPNATAPAAIAGTAGKVQFNWTDNSGVNIAKGTDIALLMVHCPALKQTIYNKAGAARNAASDILDVTPFSGKTVETWIAFISADGTNVSDSYYTGSVTVL